jgi:hypothetical protein
MPYCQHESASTVRLSVLVAFPAEKGYGAPAPGTYAGQPGYGYEGQPGYGEERRPY